MFNRTLKNSDFKHSPDIIRKLITVNDKTTTTKDTIYIIFPERFIAKNLVTMGSIIKLISIFAVVDDKMNYGVISAPIYVDIIPTNVTNTIIDGVVNIVVEVSPGVTMPTNTLLRSEEFVYDLFDEFFLQGKVPWYLSYQLLSELFWEANKYAGSPIGNDPLSMEVLTAIIARNPDDKLYSFRKSITKKTAITSNPTYVGLNNVFYSYDNTLSKIMGGYMKQGITTAIINKETTTPVISKVLRA